MPDWSYRTLFRPLLFRMDLARARDLTLHALEALAVATGPIRLVELFGDSRPDASETRTVMGIEFRAPVGLGAGLDVHADAVRGLEQCGFGFIEIGPVTAEAIRELPIERAVRDEGLVYREALANDGLEVILGRLARRGAGVPLGIRIAHRPGADVAAAARECEILAHRLVPFAAFFVYETRAAREDSVPDYIDRCIRAIRSSAPHIPAIVLVPPDRVPADARNWIDTALASGACGCSIGGGTSQNGTRVAGAAERDRSLALLRAISHEREEPIVVIASGGIMQPADALALFDAGATLVQVHSGLVYGGPNLAKRIVTAMPSQEPVQKRPEGRALGWVGIALMGLAIVIAGSIALAIGLTRVIMPYDEQFLGLSAQALAAASPRLLAFMAHDRVTFAGSLLTLGMTYVSLAVFAIRDRANWARRTVIASSIAGFCGFFIFVGTHYFDPLHAVTTAVMFGFFLLALAGGMPTARRKSSDVANDDAWKTGLWGQTLFVLLGAGFIIGGSAICAIGVTTLFVPTDLAFMHTNREALASIGNRLIPLLAHDRAYFGTALVANGINWMLTAMWGFTRGARWLWWTFLLAGIPGFAGAIGIHAAVGYTAFEHLLPVYFAVVIWIAALALSRRYLFADAIGKR